MCMLYNNMLPANKRVKILQEEEIYIGWIRKKYKSGKAECIFYLTILILFSICPAFELSLCQNVTQTETHVYVFFLKAHGTVCVVMRWKNGVMSDARTSTNVTLCTRKVSSELFLSYETDEVVGIYYSRTKIYDITVMQKYVQCVSGCVVCAFVVANLL